MTGFTPFICEYANEELKEKLGNGICIGIIPTSEGPMNIILWDNVRTPSPSYHNPSEVVWLELLENVDNDDDEDFDDEYETEDDEDFTTVDNSVNNDSVEATNTIEDDLEPLETAPVVEGEEGWNEGGEVVEGDFNEGTPVDNNGAETVTN